MSVGMEKVSDLGEVGDWEELDRIMAFTFQAQRQKDAWIDEKSRPVDQTTSESQEKDAA